MRSNTLPVEGHCKAGLEDVKDAFESIASKFGNGGGAICVYIDGSEVLHLWSGQSQRGADWKSNTLATIFSTSKALAALCAQILYDRGRLDIEAPVSRYWPEFAQKGKEKALVRHVLTHTVGVVAIENPDSLLNFDGNRCDDYDAIANSIAVMPPAWEPGTRTAYHAYTYGYMVGEIVRRITGHTIGEFFNDEVARPLGLEIWIGTPVEQQLRMADVVMPGEDQLSPQVAALIRHKAISNSLTDTTTSGLPGSNFVDIINALNKPRLRSAELPWGNASATAPSLARLFAMLSQSGELDGVRIVSPESVRKFGTIQPEVPRASLPMELHFEGDTEKFIPTWALGYGANGGPRGSTFYFGPNRSAFGHYGAGGNIGFCDPERKLALSFVRSVIGLGDQAPAVLIDALYKCLDN